MVDNIPDKRHRRLAIRDFILENVAKHEKDISRLVQQRFTISREAANRHIHALVMSGELEASGRTRSREYRLRDLTNESFSLAVEPGLDEDVQWRRHVRPLLRGLPENVVGICNYGFTEMFNNVIEHANSPVVTFCVRRDALFVEIDIDDQGVGIFEKLRTHFGLEDARHALLELSKGKLTSDPGSHTGEGIFFTSRMFDEFSIASGTLLFIRENKDNRDWLLNVKEEEPVEGTKIKMKLRADSKRTSQEVYEAFAGSDRDYGFTRTVVPVELAQYEGERLISRSQAKRLVARFDRFVEVVLDFNGVSEIGPAFADEIFRVYTREHPTVHLCPTNTTPQVSRAIQRALAAMDG